MDVAPLAPGASSRLEAAAMRTLGSMRDSDTFGADAASVARRKVVPRSELYAVLRAAARLTHVSAPAGSGKTSLLRSWIEASGLADRAAWVSVTPEQREPQRFWLSVLAGLRETTVGSELVRGVSSAPDLDVWGLVEQLLGDLVALEGPLWLVVDDLHELRAEEAIRQLELMLLRAPAALRFVLLTRHDLPLKLHRLRLEGGLTEIRREELRFSLDESRTLLEGAGVRLSEPALARLVERTEGWAAGLRLAALSLSSHPDPERFAAEFSGSERTVSEYLLAEVLERQPEKVRRLLLRTSMLDRVSGPLADFVVGGVGAEQVLQGLEEANAFVFALDAGRSWFRYHRLFGDLLALELRRTAPDELPALHASASEWFAEHGYPVEAIRYAQTGGKWIVAARLLIDHWLGLYLDGQGSIMHELLTGFPADVIADDPELAALAAADELSHRSPAEAERYLAGASRGLSKVPPERRARFELILAVLRLSLARLRGDLPAVTEGATRILATVDTPEAEALAVGDDLRCFALITLGVTELWALQLADAEEHLDRGYALACEIERPYLQVTALTHGSLLASYRSYTLAAERSAQAIEMAERHGWEEEPVAGLAYAMLGGAVVGQGRLEEAEVWLARAARTLVAETDSSATAYLHMARGVLALVRGNYKEALDSFRASERVASLLLTAGPAFVAVIRSFILQTLVKMGATARAEAMVSQAQRPCESRYMAIALAVPLAAILLAQDDPSGATLALAPVLEHSIAADVPDMWSVHAFLLEAIARDRLRDVAACERALERALDLAEPDGVLLPFLLEPAPALLERHSRHVTTHASLIGQVLNVQSDASSAPRVGESAPLREPLSESELRVLRYLPTNLSRPEIAAELCVSVHTVKTHVQHLYFKLGAHGRADAVERARGLGLLSPAARG